MYVGWTYEIDAEAEVIYTNSDPSNWLVDHRWTYDTHPHISKSGRGGVRDFFTDFRFQKVLELSDRDSEHGINVSCSVRDVRYPQFDLRMSDSDVVKFLIGGVDYNPADLVCISLKDVVMFESAGEFAMYYEVPNAKIGGGFSVKIYPDTSTSQIQISDLIVANKGFDFIKVAFAYEFDSTKVVVDCDNTKYQNKYLSTGNYKFFTQQKGWTHGKIGKVAVICDDSLSSGLLDPNDRNSPLGSGECFHSCLGSLGTDWNIFNHKDLSLQQCKYDEFWNEYSLYIYVDRTNLPQLPILEHVLQRVQDGDAGLIIWGEGSNASLMAEKSTGVTLNNLLVYGAEQRIDSNWGSEPHPVSANIALTSELINVKGYEGFESTSDLSAVSEWYDWEPEESLVQLKEIRLQLYDNDKYQPKRRRWWVEIDDSVGVNKSCGTTRALVTVVDDEVQIDEDQSWVIGHDHTLGNEGMTESFKFASNTWYRWDNKLYTDLSANRYLYTLGFPQCGDPRQVNAEVIISNRSGETLKGEVFNQVFSIGAGDSEKFGAAEYRSEKNPSNTGFGYLLIESPNEQEWEIQFRFLDDSPCPGEPDKPVECGKDYSVQTRQAVTLPYNEDIPDDCTDFVSQVIVNPCGSDRRIPVLVRLTNNEPDACTITLKNRDGETHTERLLGYGGVLNIEMECPYPIEGNLFPPPDEYAWIIEIHAKSDAGKTLPKFYATVDVQDTSTCGMGGPGFSCPESTMPNGDVGYYWNIGDVIDGEQYVFDNQDNLCGQIYDGFKFLAANLSLPWADRNIYRYRVELEFETRAKGQYTYDVLARFNGDFDSTIWTSANRPETWTNEYILMNGDYNVGGIDLFTEKYAVSFRALDADARTNFKWKVRFNREKLVGGVWVEANRKPYQGWTRKHIVTQLPFVGVQDLIPTTVSSWTIAENIVEINTFTGVNYGGVPSKGDIQVKELYQFDSLSFDKVQVYEDSEGSMVAKESYQRDQMEAIPSSANGKQLEISYTITESEIAQMLAKDPALRNFAVSVKAYVESQSMALGTVKKQTLGGKYTKLPKDSLEFTTPTVSTLDEFKAAFPVDTNFIQGAVEIPNSYKDEFQGKVTCEGFYAARFYGIYNGNTPKTSRAQITVYLAGKSKYGIVVYDRSDNVIYEQIVFDNRVTFTNVSCNQIGYIDVYTLDGKAFASSNGTQPSSMFIKIKG